MSSGEFQKPVMQNQVVQKKVAPCLDRLVGYTLDSVLSNGSFLCCIFYPLWKDGIKNGQSYGKKFVDLRVVKYNTGQPAEVGDSIVRNCGEPLLGCCTCGCTSFISLVMLLFTEEKRRVGDYLAGTIVIVDE
ncbi:MAG: RDD family protein [Candidatus Hodarchaeales archaeon]|jgi:uncharacterized RDD family membrane protein YckC